jgi:hypothetical protein
LLRTSRDLESPILTRPQDRPQLHKGRPTKHAKSWHEPTRPVACVVDPRYRKRFSRAIASSVGVKISLSGARVVWPPFQRLTSRDIFWRNDTAPSLELFQPPRIAIRQGGGWVNQLRRHFVTSSTSSEPGEFRGCACLLPRSFLQRL